MLHFSRKLFVQVCFPGHFGNLMAGLEAIGAGHFLSKTRGHRFDIDGWHLGAASTLLLTHFLSECVSWCMFITVQLYSLYV
mgnify:FL=1